MQKPWVVGGSIAFAGIVIGLFLVVYGVSKRSHAEEAQAAAAETARVAAFNAAVASAQAEQDRNAAAAAASAHAANVKYMATLDPKERSERVHNCIVAPRCGDFPDLLASAKTDAERRKLTLVADSARVESAAAQASDGPKVSPAAFKTLAALITVGPAALDGLEATTMGKAKKDPSEERGKLMRVSGTIVQIHAEAGNETGTMMTEGGNFVFFMSPYSTALTEDSWASFKGAFVQEYDYANVSGGETQSVLLVGKFN